MRKKEFEEFYKYLTALDINQTEEQESLEIKEAYWKHLQTIPLDLAMKKAKEVYRHFLIPCNLNMVNPKVFSGENPNPGLFRKSDFNLPC